MKGSGGVFQHEDVGYIVVIYRVYKEDAQYVSECLELGVSSCGDTIDQAFEAIGDATLTYLNALEDHNERARVFKERGIKVIRGEPQPEIAKMKVPMGLSEYFTRQNVRLPKVHIAA